MGLECESLQQLRVDDCALHRTLAKHMIDRNETPSMRLFEHPLVVGAAIPVAAQKTSKPVLLLKSGARIADSEISGTMAPPPLKLMHS